MLESSSQAGTALERARSRVVAAARALTRDIRLGARAPPQTQEDLLREILRVQQEQLTLLRALQVSNPFFARFDTDDTSPFLRRVKLLLQRVIVATKGVGENRDSRLILMVSEYGCSPELVEGRRKAYSFVRIRAIGSIVSRMVALLQFYCFRLRLLLIFKACGAAA